jgi:GTP cyclohydrolase-4
MGLATAYIGLGANLGDREQNLLRGLVLLHKKARVQRLSSIYETEPVDYAEQPKFLNCVGQVVTSLQPLELLEYCKSIEQALGRRPSFPNAPRPLDLDILFYDSRTVSLPGLSIPHPRLAERAFVLVPLAELAPDLVHPGLGKTVGELAAGVTGKEGVTIWKPSRQVALAFRDRMGSYQGRARKK